VRLRARPLVSLICVSHRPGFLEHALTNLRRQTYPEIEVIFVLNGDGFDRAAVEERLAGWPRARCLVGGAHLTLAEGLNMALDQATGDYVAKIDDDDHYGPNYIADAIMAAEIGGADIVGKRSHYCYLEALDTLVIRFPRSEFEAASLIQGATIVAARRVVERVRFTPVRQGTDTIFLKACKEEGFSMLAADRFNFVYARRLDPRDHTWALDLGAFLKTCEVVGPGLGLDRVFV
jgi:glycosyltransferase involved in cell wall biosynthesis